MKDLAGKTIKGIHWVGSIKIITQIISWVITIFVARLLSPSDYGLMGIALIVIGFAVLFSEFGFGMAIIQKKDIRPEQLGTVFWISLINGSALFFMFYFLSPVIGNFFNSQNVVPVLRVLSVNFILASITTLALSILNKELRFKERSFVEFVSSMISNLITLIFAYIGYGVWSLVIGAISRYILLLLLLSCCKNVFPKLHFSLKSTYSLFNFGANIVGSRMLWYLYSKTDFFIIGKVVGERGLGVYSMAFQIASTPLDKVAEIVNPVAYASFSKLQDDIDNLRIYFLQFTKGLCFVLFPALLGLLMVSDGFVRCVLTEQWISIIFPVKILCVVGMIRGAVSPIASLLNARGKASLNLKYNIINIIIMPLAFFIGATLNGLNGVVLAWIFIYPILASYILRLGLREVNLSFFQYLKNIFPIILSTVLMGVALFLAKMQLGDFGLGWLGLVSLVSLGASCYLGCLYLLMPELKDEMYAFLAKR